MYDCVGAHKSTKDSSFGIGKHARCSKKDAALAALQWLGFRMHNDYEVTSTNFALAEKAMSILKGHINEES
jgi:hypothetical protein